MRAREPSRCVGQDFSLAFQDNRRGDAGWWACPGRVVGVSRPGRRQVQHRTREADHATGPVPPPTTNPHHHYSRHGRINIVSLDSRCHYETTHYTNNYDQTNNTDTHTHTHTLHTTYTNTYLQHQTYNSVIVESRVY